MYHRPKPGDGSYLGGTRAGIFFEMDKEFRVMAYGNSEYIRGSNRSKTGILAFLPKGKWTVVQYDFINKTTKVLDESASGQFTFSVPESRAAATLFKRKP